MKSQLILRLGTHAEKDYVDKTLHKWDALIVGANLMEATPGATSSLVVRCETNKPRVPVYLDPMTYAFGPYPSPGSPQTDLDWIKSDQVLKKEGNKKIIQRKFKRSYVALAEQYGGLFEIALGRSRAIGLDDLRDPKARRTVAAAVVEYQLNRAKNEFRKDPEFANLADDVPAPPAAFAPYFYIQGADTAEWTEVNIALATDAVKAADGKVPVHAILAMDNTWLGVDPAFVIKTAEGMAGAGVKGLWLWFSEFKEHSAAPTQLETFRQLVEILSKKVAVFNLHGGFLSLAFCHYGLSGVSHGVGYGEQKDVLPVIGQSTPTVYYYVPAVRQTRSVLALERSFPELGITTPKDFFEKICDCVICQGMLKKDLKAFVPQFGGARRSRPDSLRDSQTPEAARLCRFHYLLCRFAERDWVSSVPLEKLREELAAAKTIWESLAAFKGGKDAEHLERWREVLKP